MRVGRRQESGERKVRSIVRSFGKAEQVENLQDYPTQQVARSGTDRSFTFTFRLTAQQPHSER